MMEPIRSVTVSLHNLAESYFLLLQLLVSAVGRGVEEASFSAPSAVAFGPVPHDHKAPIRQACMALNGTLINHAAAA
jgi:hypothetical protein